MELTLTADGQCVLDRNIMESIGALPPGKAPMDSRQQDGSVRICAKDMEDTLTTVELVHELEQIMGHAKIVNAPIEEIQQAIASGYIEHGMRGLK